MYTYKYRFIAELWLNYSSMIYNFQSHIYIYLFALTFLVSDQFFLKTINKLK